MRAVFGVVIFFLLFFCSGFAAQGDEYDFDIPEAEKSNFEFGGKLEMKYIYHQLDRQSAVYHLRFPDGDLKSINEYRPQIELSADYNFGSAQLFLTTHHEYRKTYEDEEWINKVYEAYVAFRPTPGLTVDAGKKSYLWGKGYAWNPAGFINRPKDPDDPELNLEGYTAISVDFIKSFSNDVLQTMAFTPVVLPVFEWENDDLGDPGDIDYAFKLYFLLFDTDIDLMYFDGPEQPTSLGLDFSRNIKENLEIHGELALKFDVDKTVLNATGKMVNEVENQWSWLLGTRYLTSYDTTFILEYYHNGAGYGSDEIETFFEFQDAAYQNYLTTGRLSPLSQAAQTANVYYSQRNYGQDYLYLKISQKEPFDILYFTPYITSIVNLNDGSFNVTPGLTYLPWTDVEFGWKIMVPIGPSGTEYGEKLDRFRMEILLRYYF